MKNTCYQLTVDYSWYKATVWDCDAKFEFEILCNTGKWSGETSINEVNYDIKNTLDGVFFKYIDSIVAEIDFFTRDSWKNFAEISFQGEKLSLKKSNSFSGLELTNTDSATVLKLELNWHVDDKKNWLMRLLTRQQYYLVRQGDVSMNQLELLQLIAICGYCVVVLASINTNDYSGKLSHVPMYEKGKRRPQWFDFWKHNR